MSNLLSRAQVIEVLKRANIEFDPELTMVQLRPLYDDLILKLNVQQPSGSGELPRMDMDGSFIVDIPDEQNPDELAKQQQQLKQKEIDELQKQITEETNLLAQQNQQKQHDDAVQAAAAAAKAATEAKNKQQYEDVLHCLQQHQQQQKQPQQLQGVIGKNGNAMQQLRREN